MYIHTIEYNKGFVLKIQIDHFSDVLCAWAYFSEPRMAEVRNKFGDKVEIRHRFVSVFGDVPGKMVAQWAAKGGFEGFGQHTFQNGQNFPELPLSAKVWRDVRPMSSLGPHLYCKAVFLLEADGKCAAGTFAKVLAKIRKAFFAEGRDIGVMAVQQEVGAELGIAPHDIATYLSNGAAAAALMADYKQAEQLQISGSPTLVLNNGRQKLYGNVGYRIIEANILELLRDPRPEDASWC